MDYSKHYNLLIDRAKNRILMGYQERHHIVPKCIGGTDDQNNLVSLTPEEHYVAHLLLVKMYPDHSGLVYAANMMTVKSSLHERRNNKSYGWLKKKYVVECKKKVGELASSYGKSWYTNFSLEKCIKLCPHDYEDNYKNKGYVKCRVQDFTLYDEFGNRKKQGVDIFYPSTQRKLSNSQAVEIFYSNESQNKLSKLYGVDRVTIRNIKNRKSYKDATKRLTILE